MTTFRRRCRGSVTAGVTFVLSLGFGHSQEAVAVSRLDELTDLAFYRFACGRLTEAYETLNKALSSEAPTQKVDRSLGHFRNFFEWETDCDIELGTGACHPGFQAEAKRRVEPWQREDAAPSELAKLIMVLPFSASYRSGPEHGQAINQEIVETYKKIIKKYPQSPWAEWARWHLAERLFELGEASYKTEFGNRIIDFAHMIEFEGEKKERNQLMTRWLRSKAVEEMWRMWGRIENLHKVEAKLGGREPDKEALRALGAACGKLLESAGDKRFGWTRILEGEDLVDSEWEYIQMRKKMGVKELAEVPDDKEAFRKAIWPLLVRYWTRNDRKTILESKREEEKPSQNR